ncbi:MAG: PIN domain-containing protein [Hormoscilla sp. GM7CHS1pb]|nr:PIN domain-containing protein [Hormoscilla sp. GM7CHS1pb]
MAFLIDTNVLLRNVQPHHPMHSSGVSAIRILLARDEDLCIVPQNIIEFWNVCTRPVESNGLGMTAAQAEAEVREIERIFSMRLDRAQMYQEWRRLVANYAVKGVKVHDAKLVASMLVHGLTHILTFNFRDFARYSEVTAVHPDDVQD